MIKPPVIQSLTFTSKALLFPVLSGSKGGWVSWFSVFGTITLLILQRRGVNHRCSSHNECLYFKGPTHTRQSVLCLRPPKSSLFGWCEHPVPCPSIARFVGPCTVGRGGLQHSTDAHARAQANITVIVCGGSTLDSGRQQYTAWIKNSGKIHNHL